ncbi:hypothetical protein BGW41_006959 [Actinomortierella wolfii]|nr:hypothetical protein BGW41_006959 [Actinomortierella wolfii]
MLKQSAPTYHHGIIHGLRLICRVPVDPSRLACRRHQQYRTLCQQSRLPPGIFGRTTTSHHYQPTLITRRQYATVAEKSDPATKHFPAIRKRRQVAHFTPEDDAKILDMRLEGATWKEIGDALGFEANACHLRYKKFLDPQLRVGWTEANKEKLNSMVARREPWSKIALELNIASQVCREKWMELNHSKLMAERLAKLEERRLARKKALQDAIANGERRVASRLRWTPTLDALLLELHGRGWTWRQIGRVFGFVPMACYNRYKITLLAKLKSGWTPPQLNENFLPYFLRKNSGSRHPHLPSSVTILKDPSGQIGSRWYAMQQMAGILNGELDATIQPTDSEDHAPPALRPISSTLTMGEEFPYSGTQGTHMSQRVWTAEEDETILRLYKEGQPFHSIARILGVNTRDVSVRFQTVLDPDLHHEWTPEMLDRLSFLVFQGLSWVTISSNLGKKISVCKAKWQELQRLSKPSSTTVRKDVAKHQQLDLDHEHHQPSQSSSTQASQEVSNSTNSVASAEDSREEPSSPSQSHNRDNNDDDAWGDEAVASHSSTNYANVDLVDEYDIDDQDDHAESQEEDDYFEDDEDDEDDENDTSMMFDQEREITGNSSRRRKAKASERTNKSSSSRSPLSPNSLPSKYWDQNAVLRAISRNWTVEEETVLIQHVLKHGPRDWDLVSRKIKDARAKRALETQANTSSPTDNDADPLSGTVVLHHERFSPEECQAYWKHLDLPVRRQTVVTLGEKNVQWLFESDKQQMARFWQLWLEHGSDFDTIASRLSESSRQDENSMASEDTNYVTAAQCRQYFEEKTEPLRRSTSATEAVESGEPESTEQPSTSTVSERVEDGTPSEGDYYQSCVQLAKTLAEEPKFQWSKERSVILQKLVRQRLRTRGVQLNWINWKWVARHVGGGATPVACSMHWRSLRQISAQQQVHQDQGNSDDPTSAAADLPWTEQEVLLLEQGVRDIGVGFNAINGPTMFLRTLQRFYLPHRPLSAIQKKYFTLSDKATEVTLHEYSAIMESVDEISKETLADLTHDLDDHSTTEVAKEVFAPSSSLWDKVVQRMNKKYQVSGWTKAPIRRVFESSYQHYLQFKAASWTKDDDQDLIRIVEWVGPEDWLSVARFFPDRSPWECRLRWCSLIDEIDLTKASSS